MPDAQRMANRWAQGVQNNQSRWVEGMENPRRDPKQAAIAAAGKWANRLQEAIQNQHYAAGIRRYDVNEARRIATEDGGAAYVAGATKRQSKAERAFQVLAPMLDQVSQQVQNMPQDTEQQREARALAAIRGMRNVGRQFRQARS